MGRPAEHEDGGGDREEQPGLQVQLEERVHPVDDVETLREEHEEEGGREEADREPVLALLGEEEVSGEQRGRTPARKNASGKRTARKARAAIASNADEPSDVARPDAALGQPSARRPRATTPTARKKKRPNTVSWSTPRRRGLEVPADAGPAPGADPERECEQIGRGGRRRESAAPARAERTRARPGAGMRATRQRDDDERARRGAARPRRSSGPGTRRRSRAAPRRRGAARQVEAGSPCSADEVEGRGGEEQEDRNREDVRVQVREDEAPERVLVDRVLDDARGRPEVVPVERGACGRATRAGPRGCRARSVSAAPAMPARRRPPQLRASEKAPCRIVPPRKPNARLNVKRVERFVRSVRKTTISWPNV